MFVIALCIKFILNIINPTNINIYTYRNLIYNDNNLLPIYTNTFFVPAKKIYVIFQTPQIWSMKSIAGKGIEWNQVTPGQV